MTIRTVLLGGTDWSDGQVLYAADMNDTFDAETDAIAAKRLKQGIILGTDTVISSATTYTAQITHDLSAVDCISVDTMFTCYAAGGSAQTTGFWKVVATLSDASEVDIFAEITITASNNDKYTSRVCYNAPSGKTITKIEFQSKMTAGGNSTGYYKGSRDLWHLWRDDLDNAGGTFTKYHYYD